MVDMLVRMKPRDNSDAGSTPFSSTNVIIEHFQQHNPSNGQV